MYRSSVSSIKTPCKTIIPEFFNFLIPFPLTRGFLSKDAITTLLIPLLIISSTQGGFLPEWEHGSSVVYNVEPALIFIPFSAFFSA